VSHDPAGNVAAPLRHPPRLRSADAETHRHATWMELFFDLVFVAAVARLAEMLIERHDATGFLRFFGLFVPVAWAWMGYTYYANRFDTDDVPYRAMVSAGMAAVAAMAVAIGDFSDEGLMRFALAYAAVRLVLLLMYVRARRHVPEMRAALDFYLVGFGLGALCWIASAFVTGPAREVLWFAGLALEFGTPIVGWRVIATAPIDRHHLEERFGLFTIIVLGEAVIAVVIGTDVSDWAAPAILVAVAGFASVVALWWTYFDLNGAVQPKRGWWAFVFAYGHVPLWIALTAFGAGVKLAIKHAEDVAHDPGSRWALVGGAALFFVAVTAFHIASSRREPGIVSGLRVLVVAGLVAIAAAGSHLPQTTVSILVLFAIGIGLLLEALSVREAERGALMRMVSPPERPAGLPARGG
jgi:low temperature requirement protein LtrA